MVRVPVMIVPVLPVWMPSHISLTLLRASCPATTFLGTSTILTLVKSSICRSPF